MSENNTITMDIRVRYAECDPMGFVHHANYPIYLEMVRTELLRRNGDCYAEMEASGIFIVVARMNLSYKSPAHYDDLLKATATLTRANGAKIEHEYQIHRDKDLILTASTTLACIDSTGRIQRVPESIRNSQ